MSGVSAIQFVSGNNALKVPGLSNFIVDPVSGPNIYSGFEILSSRNSLGYFDWDTIVGYRNSLPIVFATFDQHVITQGYGNQVEAMLTYSSGTNTTLDTANGSLADGVWYDLSVTRTWWTVSSGVGNRSFVGNFTIRNKLTLATLTTCTATLKTIQ